MPEPEHCWRLATYNIESLDWTASDPEGFAARLAALRPKLAAARADILCLQEVNAQSAPGRKTRAFTALERLVAGTPYESFHLAHSVRPGAGRPADVHNLAILSRWPILERIQIFHDIVPVWRLPPIPAGAPRPEVRWDRPLLAARIALPGGQPLVVINLHLRAPRAAPIHEGSTRRPNLTTAAWAQGFHLAGLKRQGQALEARLFVERLFDENPHAWIVVCGDLNADTFETPTRILQAGFGDIERMDLRGRALEPLESRVPAAQRYSVIHDGRKVLLDHILASEQLARLCAGVAIDIGGLEDEFTAQEPAPASFHAPVIATFEHPPPPGAATPTARV